MSRRILTLGAGGAGMTPLSLYLHESGCKVDAYDDAFRQPIRELLLSRGVRLPDSPILPADLDQVVFSTAIKDSHPLLSQALEKGVAVSRRGEALAGILQDKKLVAVVGSHGKTTTAAMLVHLLGFIDLPFGYLVGGWFREGLPPARWSQGEWVVAEVDESDGSIEAFSPEITVALNCDWDHVDLYNGVDELQAAFGRLFARTKSKVIVRQGHALEQLARVTATCEIETFGPDGDFDASVKDVSPELIIRRPSNKRNVTELVRAMGEFNGWNAIAALAACQAIGDEAPLGRLRSFPGLQRRQVVLHETSQRVIMEDYAHHPTELQAVLNGFRSQWPNHATTVVFQPHRFSRQEGLRESFAKVLSQVDQLHLLPTYGAGETPTEDGRPEGLLALLPARLRGTQVHHSFSELRQAIGNQKNPNGVLFLGAGDIERHAAAFAHLEETKGDLWLAFAYYLRDRLSNAAELRMNEPLSEKTTLRVGGKARLYCEPAGAEDLRELILAVRLFGLPLFALGRGSNLIVPAEGYEGVVFCMRGKGWREVEMARADALMVGSGVRLKEICLFAASQGLEGFEFLEGIPGSLGGALRMNAGAMGGTIFDLVENVTVMTSQGERREMLRDEFDARYRECPELEAAFVLNATLRSRSKATKGQILDRLRSFSKIRNESQPREASAGCIFRNPGGQSAGRLIDEEGLKGFRVGAAEVSRKHGNFIVNRGGATTEDVLSLIRLVRGKVKETRGIELVPEVKLMGKSWEEALEANQ